MESLLLYIKHNLKPLWNIIERCNELSLRVLYNKKLSAIQDKYRNPASTNNEFHCRLITPDDTDMLYGLLSKLDKSYLKYFNPHGFTYDELKHVLKSKNFLTLGYFHNQKLIGYFMLRLFASKKAFGARVVDSDYNGRGIGKDMAKIMYGIANELGWAAYATISEKNIASFKTHNYEIVKKLPNGYVLIRYNTTSTDW